MQKGHQHKTPESHQGPLMGCLISSNGNGLF